MNFDDELTPGEQNMLYLQQNPAVESSLWAEWVGVVCGWDKIAPPTAAEWVKLRANFHHDKAPVDSVAELKSMRQPMKQPETLTLVQWLERYEADCQGNLDVAAEFRRLYQLNTDMLEALQAGPSTFHTLPRGEVCQCSQCQFVRLRNAAIEKATKT